ncbi:MAG: polysaccharide biosynthesis protein [Oscillospiraceae bacterium]|nr:polysaccharide biosynthesis protein [Oscillospiraceae bacterium]
MSGAKKQNYLHGAAIMVGTTVIVKIVAFLYKIPLGDMRILGDEGFAHFTVAYNIYGFILTLATAGFPVALSRMISVADAEDRPAQVQRIFHVALGVLTAIGGFFTLLMLSFHRPLSAMMGDREAALSIAALAPAVVIVCATSAYRGYCQGRGNMIPTAFGQVVEEVGKLVIGLSLAWIIARRGLGLARASAGAIFGVTAGALAALAYMAVYKRRYYPDRAFGADEVPDSRRTIVREFLRIGIPIAVGASVLSLINLLDNALCLNRLQSAAGFPPQAAHTLYGVYGKAQTLYNLPSYFITPLTLSVVPAIATALTRREQDAASEVAESSLRIASLIAMPMGVGLFVLAGPVFRVIYWGSNPAGPTLLRLLGIAAFFVCMSMMCNAILQAGGKERLPIVSIIVGGAVKIGVNWVLVGNPHINITGAPIGSICCFGAICALDYVFLCRTLKNRPRLIRVLGLPLLSCAVMGASAWAVYGLLARALSRPDVPMDRLPMAAAMLAAIAAAVIVYAVMIVLTGAVTMEDMALIPHGEKLGKLLHLKKTGNGRPE